MTEDHNYAHLALFVLGHLGKPLDVSLHLNFALVLDSLALNNVKISVFIKIYNRFLWRSRTIFEIIHSIPSE